MTSITTRAATALGTISLATGLVVLVPAATGQEQANAAGGVYNSCKEGYRNSLPGITYPSGYVRWIGCGQSGHVDFVRADAPTRFQREGQSGSVCYRGGAWFDVPEHQVTRAWVVPSC